MTPGFIEKFEKLLKMLDEAHSQHIKNVPIENYHSDSSGQVYIDCNNFLQRKFTKEPKIIIKDSIIGEGECVFDNIDEALKVVSIWCHDLNRKPYAELVQERVLKLFQQQQSFDSFLKFDNCRKNC